MLRINRFRLAAADVDPFAAFCAGELFPDLATKGMAAAYVGTRERDGVHDVVVASRFPRIEALFGVAGTNLDRPAFLGDAWRDRLIDPKAEHFDAMDLEQPPAPPDAPGLLRIYRGTIDEDRAAEYYEYIRREGWPAILQRPGIVAGFSGRRMAGGTHRFAFVTVWRAIEDLPDADEASGPPLSHFPGVGDEVVEHFRLIATS